MSDTSLLSSTEENNNSHPGNCFANTPAPPYVAVIFTSKKSVLSNSANDASTESTTNSAQNKCDTTSIPDYSMTAQHMLNLAHTMDGFLGEESVRDPHTHVGITVSYWRDNQAVLNWKQHTEHLEAQKNGRKYWYDNYSIRVCQVERAYTWTK